MKKKYGVYWLTTQRKIYGDDSYYALGTLMGTFDTIKEAEIKIKSINSTNALLTIIPIYSPKSKQL